MTYKHPLDFGGHAPARSLAEGRVTRGLRRPGLRCLLAQIRGLARADGFAVSGRGFKELLG
jgi:hypothetical protein